MSNLAGSGTTPKSDNWIGYAHWLAGGCALTLIVAYCFIFSSLPWTENPASWGAFGDYIGGLMNPTIAFFTLMVAIQVWRLQRTQLSETKLALDKQTEHLYTTNHREQQSTNEKLFFSVLEKIASAALQLRGRPRDQSVDTLAASLRCKQVSIDGNLVNFSEAYKEQNRSKIDEIIGTSLEEVSIYLDMVELALQIIENRIDDKKIFGQLFCTQVGKGQLSLITLMTCSSKLKELHRLVLLFKLNEKLPLDEFASHLSNSWHTHMND